MINQYHSVRPVLTVVGSFKVCRAAQRMMSDYSELTTCLPPFTTHAPTQSSTPPCPPSKHSNRPMKTLTIPQSHDIRMSLGNLLQDLNLIQDHVLTSGHQPLADDFDRKLLARFDLISWGQG